MKFASDIEAISNIQKELTTIEYHNWSDEIAAL